MRQGVTVSIDLNHRPALAPFPVLWGIAKAVVGKAHTLILVCLRCAGCDAVFVATSTLASLRLCICAKFVQREICWELRPSQARDSVVNLLIELDGSAGALSMDVPEDDRLWVDALRRIREVRRRSE